MVDVAFLVLIGFLYPPPAWEVFFSGQKSSPKDHLSVVVVYVLLCSVLALLRFAQPRLSRSR